MDKSILNKIRSSKTNAVLDIHTLLSTLPVLFRESVCEECNWSIPTFYRKLRTKDVVNPQNPKLVISVVSKAEKDTIIDIVQQLYIATGVYLSKYDPKEAPKKSIL